MKLLALDCSFTQVSSLSPLKGMPLTWLSCERTQVSDLSPLTGMATLCYLSGRRTKVTAAGVAALEKSLPIRKGPLDRDIEWDDPANPPK
jgi:hypothetical protein